MTRAGIVARVRQVVAKIGHLSDAALAAELRAIAGELTLHERRVLHRVARAAMRATVVEVPSS